MPESVNIDEGERLLAKLLTAEAENRRGLVWWAGHIRAEWCKWSEKNMPALFARIRDLENQLAQLTQARDAGEGGDDGKE